ncbi:MAG TPA: methionine ABC transporter ATP-binding protein [Stellaceae bacterium]|nr:methionine ABC transporter ATP-binding protein [Stellaceae bacterium]
MIVLADVHKNFSGPNGIVRALDDVSLSVEAGEIFGIIGRSGAGKSTLLRTLNLLERPDSGRVTVDGVDLTTLDAAALRRARRRVGMIFQHFNLLARRTVYGNVALPLELAGTPAREIEAVVTPLLDLVGLTDKRDQYPATLSGGQKQRVGIARALANKPSILLCDEATSALDPQTTRSILALLADINQRLGLTIVLITHEMPVVRQICNRVAVMEHGRIVEAGSVFDLLTAPAQPITREIMRAHDGEAPLRTLYGDRLTSGPSAGASAILRISFTGLAAEEPIIADLVRRLSVDINLLHGSIDYIQGRPLGTLVVELTGPLEPAINYLTAKHLGVEVLGYVASHARVAV